MDKYNLSDEALKDIASIMRKYLNGKVNPNAVYQKIDHLSFGQHSLLINDHIGFSYYPGSNSFHGNVNNGGHFFGNISDQTISITCSQTQNSTHITL